MRRSSFKCRQLVWCNKQADEGECRYKYCVKCIAAKLHERDKNNWPHTGLRSTPRNTPKEDEFLKICPDKI